MQIKTFGSDVTLFHMVSIYINKNIRVIASIYSQEEFMTPACTMRKL